MIFPIKGLEKIEKYKREKERENNRIKVCDILLNESEQFIKEKEFQKNWRTTRQSS